MSVAIDTCIFCKIISGGIPAPILAQNELTLAIKDINPQAPHHYLILPRKHIAMLNDLRPEDAPLVGSMVILAAELAKREGFAESGYRTVFNCGPDACQTVFHIHLHVLAGRSLGWPPG